MRALVLVHIVLLIVLGGVTPLQAQLSGEDLIPRFGIQVLNGANGAGQRPVPGAEPHEPPTSFAQPGQLPARELALVAEIQRRLNELGYTVGFVDGRAGPLTRQAIAVFQRDHGLAQTGRADEGLLGALRLAQTGNAGLTAAQAPLSPDPGPSDTFTILKDYDLPYGDYRSGLDDPYLKNIGPQACQQLCAADGRCRGFTYNLRGEVCILKDVVTSKASFAGAVSGIKGAGGPGLQVAAGELASKDASSSFADFVHLALMSDTEAYLAQAAMTGAAYIQATGTEQQCRQFYKIANSDEFARRDYLDQLAALARDVIATLPTRSRRLEIPIEATYALADYDFDREGFPFASHQQSRINILTAGAVPLLKDERPASCRAGVHLNFGSGPGQVSFMDLQAEHHAAPGIDFIPMPLDQARAFRISGEGKVVLRATLVVEPRDQGRGPLKGRVASLAAHHPGTGQIVHSWNLQGGETPAAPRQNETPWTGELLASLIGPTLEPRLDPRAFDMAAARYFSYHEHNIAAGNPPPQSPLPMAEMRGRQAEVIASLNRDRLRAVLRENPPSLPLAVFVEQTVSPLFEEARGLYFNALENDLGFSGGQDSLRLSSRNLPLYEQLSFLRPWDKESGRMGFRESIVSSQGIRIALELDRIVRLEPVAMRIEQAAARGLVGYSGGGKRDSVVVRWNIDISELRAEQEGIVISASLRGLSYRWASDNTPLADLPVAAFPTVEGLRQAADAALPPRATAENVATPPAGALFGTEMADLLRLRFQPETVDDRFVERMTITRFAYEAAASQGGTPIWGNFFREFEEWPGPDERAARLGEFRAWSEARAAALPASLTISLPLDDTNEGKVAPFHRRGAHEYACAVAAEKEDQASSEKGVATSKICKVLDAAWKSPEPFLLFNEYGRECANDAYCAAKRNANIELKLPYEYGEDGVHVDRLPVLDAAVQGMKDRALALEIEVEPTGVSVQASKPESIWRGALGKVHAFDQSYGAGIVQRLPDDHPSERPVFVYHAKTTSARVVDRETGAIIAKPLLVVPAAIPFDLLDMPESKIGGLDVLGIRLGMTFGEADKVIREHMKVGKVLTADRNSQLGSVSGDIQPYTSGHIYASTEGTELIAIFDEPPAAPETVLGIWRILRLPGGGADQANLKATLAERYGEPGAVEEVSLPFMKTGLAFLWFDHRHERCESISFSYQDGLWQDENGDTSWLPPSMIRAEYPLLGGRIFLDVRNEPLPEANFCPQFLGVRYATHDGSNAGEHAGDELVTWLSDNRSYFKLFYQSRAAPAAGQSSGGEAASTIKF